MEFLPIATVVYKRIEIILDNDTKIENFSDLSRVIYDEINSLTYDNPQDLNGTKNLKEDVENCFKGYIVQLVIKGRTDIHHDIQRMTEDDYKQLIEGINEELGLKKYFLWIDSILFRTSAILQNYESLKIQNSIFNDLEEVTNMYSTDTEYKKQLVKNWGSIWKKQINTENIDEDKFDYDEDVIADIILQARELVIEKLVEALEIM